ncbi:MAG: hypothetical protein AAGA03_00465, partial [Planctomycetota bacterium]
MRLTLRTLLAYLDNALEPDDAAILRSKIEESGRAGDLMRRIEQLINHKTLGALPPDAVGPLADANAISEYLDSTLKAEQIVEIESLCRDSDISLAEAATCHQILTIVLGNQADVPDALRDRIYNLPDNEAATRELTGSFSSISIPVDQPVIQPSDDTLDTDFAQLGQAATAAAGQHPSSTTVSPSAPIQPVGPGDSGVSDAPTRLRAAESDQEVVAEPGSALAGTGPRPNVNEYYGGSIRPSRITPWLVGLAICAVLLFSLAQIFAPLLSKDRVASGPDQTVTPSEPDGGENSSVASPTQQADALESGEQSAESDMTSGDASLSEPEGEEPKSGDFDPSADAGKPAESLVESKEPDDATSPIESGAVATEPGEVESGPTKDEPMIEETIGMAPPPRSGKSSTDAVPSDVPMDASEEVAVLPTEAEEVTANDVMRDIDGTTAEQPSGPPVELAKVISNDSLLIAEDRAGRLISVSGNQKVMSGAKLVVPPYYRGRLTASAGIDISLVGPSVVQFMATPDGGTRLQLPMSQVVLVATQDDVSIEWQTDAGLFSIILPNAEDSVAIQTRHVRQPGADPVDPMSAVPVTEVVHLAGEASVRFADPQESEVGAFEGGQTIPITSGAQATWRGKRDVVVSQIEAPPAWTSSDQYAKDSLERSACRDLLAELSVSDSLESGLRESVGFRREEVGALAAKTLLLLGRSDVYFGSDGVLSQKAQRSFWSRHFDALQDR